MAQKRGLGKGISKGGGLNSLIPGSSEEKKQEKVEKAAKSTNNSTIKPPKVENKPKTSDELDGAVWISLQKIERNPDQPRKDFEEESLQELAESIKTYGIIQPLLVKPEGKRYLIIAGERRWRAAKLAGLKKVPAIVKDYTDSELVEISLIENIQRADLNVMEEAYGYKRLMDEFSYKQEDLAGKLSKSRSVIANRLRLLKLMPEVQEMLRSGALSEGHARALIVIEDPSLQLQAAKTVVGNQFSVRETEKLVKGLLAPAKPEKEDWASADQFTYDRLEEELRGSIGSKVSIKRTDKTKGKIIIEYFSEDDLERIADIINRK